MTLWLWMRRLKLRVWWRAVLSERQRALILLSACMVVVLTLQAIARHALHLHPVWQLFTGH